MRGVPMARYVLTRTRMAKPKSEIEGWTIPLHVIMWTTILVGVIMGMAIVLMHR